MQRYLYLPVIFLLALGYAWPAAARDVFQQYDQVIWIDQENQVGAAYENGERLRVFPILSGDDETPTPPGIYPVKRKDKNYFSRKYQTPMPYSLFFDLKGMRAIHEGDLPEAAEREEWATHGCIHVAEPYMKWLYDWAEPGKTVVVIEGQRLGPGPDPQEGQYEPE